MFNRAAVNYTNSHPLVVTRISLHRDRTSGGQIKKCRLEQGLFERDLAKMIGVLADHSQLGEEED
jgi:hypothetical protein